MKNKSYKIATGISIILATFGILYLVLWFIEPSEFLNTTIGIPHGIIAFLGCCVILVLIIFIILKNKKVDKGVIKIFFMLILNVCIYFIILVFGHAISVSEVYIENYGGSDITNLTITYPNHLNMPVQKITVQKIKNNSTKKIVVIPNKEGLLEIKGKLGNDEFQTNGYIAEIKGYRMYYKIKSPDDIQHRKENY